MAVEDFNRQIHEQGWYLFEDANSSSLVDRMIIDLEESYLRCREIQVQNGLDKTEGTCHHLIGQAQSFMDCLAEYEKLDEYFTAYFGGKYILNSFGGNILKKGMSYANDIHRDIRSFSGELPLMLNTLIMLDDFTEDNGATWLMNGGHVLKDKPSEEFFMQHAFQIIGKAGSIAVWNSNLWHKSGINTTNKPRRSVTPLLSRPFFKQGYYYTQFVDSNTSEYLKQILGFYSLTPTTLSHWYSKDRFYRSDQG